MKGTFGEVIAIVAASLISTVVLSIAGCAKQQAEEGPFYLLPSTYETLVKDENKLYEATDSEVGGVSVWYKDGMWVTYRNGQLYSTQQYLLPPGRNIPINTIVSEIPTYNADTATVMGFDSVTGDILTLDGNLSFTELQNSYTEGTISVYAEWQGTDGYYYSYVMQYADVSILYSNTDELNLFRGYTAYLNALSQNYNGTMTTAPVPEISENSSTANISEISEETMTTEVTQTEVETETTTTTEPNS